jgi:hypothetical protein
MDANRLLRLPVIAGAALSATSPGMTCYGLDGYWVDQTCPSHRMMN